MNELAYPGTTAATRLVWRAVILNSSETSGPLSNGLEVYIKSFGGQKGGVRSNPLELPLPSGLATLIVATINVAEYCKLKTPEASLHDSQLKHIHGVQQMNLLQQ